MFTVAPILASFTANSSEYWQFVAPENTHMLSNTGRAVLVMYEMVSRLFDKAVAPSSCYNCPPLRQLKLAVSTACSAAHRPCTRPKSCPLDLSGQQTRPSYRAASQEIGRAHV